MQAAGGYQNFVTLTGGSSGISAETAQQLAFPYHTFTIINTQTWDIVKQHTLILNPQDFNQTEPNRDSVIQTLGGAYVDDFGRGLPTVTVNGHTGWRLKASPDGSGMKDGWQAFKDLRDNVWRHYTDKKDGVRTYLRNSQYQLRWYNWGEDEYYIIQPHEFTLQRSISQPLFYVYNFRWTCLHDLLRGEGETSSTRVSKALISTKQVSDTVLNLKNLLASAK